MSRRDEEIYINKLRAIVNYGYTTNIDKFKTYLIKIANDNNLLSGYKERINNANDIDSLKLIGKSIIDTIEGMNSSGGYRNLNMNLKDVKELCKANQIKLSRVVNDKRVAYTKKELITKLKRKKLL